MPIGKTVSIISSEPVWNWRIVLAAVVVTAALLRLLSYNFSLPYIDHIDEPNQYLGALEWRGLYDSGGYYVGYPPGYLGVNLWSQWVTESLGRPGMAASVQLLRLVSIAFDLATIVFIALSIRLAGGAFASVVAAMAWAISPLVLQNNVYALPDPINAFLTVFAIWLAASALTNETRRHWVVWSTAAGTIATLLKYPVFPALLPGGLAALIICFRNRRQGITYLIIQVLLFSGAMIWLFFIYGVPVDSVEREGATIRAAGPQNLLNLERLRTNLYFALYPLRVPLFTVVTLLGGGALIILWRRGQQVRPYLLITGLCLSVIVTIPWVISAYTVVSVGYRMRDVLPATAAACIVFGLSLDLILRVLPLRARIPGGMAIAGLLALVLYIPNFNRDVEIIRERRLPDLRVDLRQWFDINLEPGTVIVDQENEKTFNPLWGGIPYRRWVDWWLSDDIMEHTVAEWREDYGISYAVIPLKQWQSLRSSNEGEAYLSQLLHLRDFTSSTPVRGPEMIVYRLWRMQHETEVYFGDHIVLTGYDQSVETARPGDSVDFTFYWNAPAPPDDNYSLFVHLVLEAEYQVVAQVDSSPAVPERLTLTWNEPGETLISPPFTLAIPPDLPPGDYRVMIGLYNFETGQRLPVTGAELGDAYQVTLLHVIA